MTSTDALMSVVAAWAAACVAGYLAVGLAAAVAAHRVGSLRDAAERVLLLYPPFARAALRAVVVAALGVGAATPASVAFAAADGGSAPQPPVVAPAQPHVEPLDWPIAVRPHLARARHPRPATPATRDAVAAAQADIVTVRDGDCLWTIAARGLGAGATRDQIAQAWPQWWAANRRVIGGDPAVLHPGERLRVPDPFERRAS